MKTERTKKTIVISVILLLAGASLAFARGGSWGDRGPMMGPGDYGPRGVCYAAELSDDQRAELTAARETFFAKTRVLREQIREKRWALRDELAKPDPDAGLAAQLQGELSQLQGAFDQRAVEHRLEMRRILPEGAGVGGFGRNANRGFRGGSWR